MQISISAGAVLGIDAQLVNVEVKISPGIKYFLVGLADNAVKEGYYRIEAALESCGIKIPRKKIIVNLAPADLKKVGSCYDLPIASGILLASNKISSSIYKDYIIMGELALNANVLPIKGALSITILAKKLGYKGVVIPEANLQECSLIDGLEIIGVRNLKEVISFLVLGERPKKITDKIIFSDENESLDMLDVKGQTYAKRALCIAAAGGHNIIMIGSPGSGKSMLSKRLSSILPSLSKEESIECTQLFSIAGRLKSNQYINKRPFRAPHHTISNIALVGGGNVPRPGEVSLAHNGVLFLDEMLEFRPSSLEVLRQPMEDCRVNISRAKYQTEFPAKFMLVGAMNPCPCGYLGDPSHSCQCTESIIQKYRSKLSGPLMDRIDIHLHIKAVSYKELTLNSKEEKCSKEWGEIVLKARNRQKNRFCDPIPTNGGMSEKLILKHCTLDYNIEEWLKKTLTQLSFSARTYFKLLKLSRTIADVEESINIKKEHLVEAIQLRGLDRVNNY